MSVEGPANVQHAAIGIFYQYIKYFTEIMKQLSLQ